MERNALYEQVAFLLQTSISSNAKKYLSIAKGKGYSKKSINKICKDLHLFRFLIIVPVSDVNDGTYRNEVDGSQIEVRHGYLMFSGEPVIFRG